MKFDIRLEWKTFPIDCADFNRWLKSNAGEHYDGISSDYALTIHFKQEPSEQVKATIQGYWDALQAHSELSKREHHARLQRAENAARVGLPYQAWDQMKASERKMLMNSPLSDEDREELLQKYPQV